MGPVTQVAYPNTELIVGLYGGAPDQFTSIQSSVITTRDMRPLNILDVSGNLGTDGQVLSSKGPQFSGGDSTLMWVDLPAPPGTPNLNAVLTEGSDAGQQPITNLSELNLKNAGGDITISLLNSGGTVPLMIMESNATSTSHSKMAEDYVQVFGADDRAGNYNAGLLQSGSLIFNENVSGSAVYQTNYNYDSLVSTKPNFNLQTSNGMYLNGASSTEGQVFTADASGNPIWADLPAPPTTPSLAEVLAIGADASFNLITSIGALYLNSPPEPGFPSPADPVQLGQVQANGFLGLGSNTASQVIDETKAVKSFSGNYMCINIMGTNYYMPLFVPV
jgi:hypothetical protein